jgi:hypothetical protein
MDCFREVSVKSTILEQVQAVVEDTSPWGLYYNFIVKSIPKIVIEQDSFLKKLHAKFPFTPYVFKVLPNSFYNWHLDSKRGCSVNMLLSTDTDSHCLFSIDNTNITFKFVELQYEKHKYYAFNTQEPHCVINLGNPRYLFSIEFEEQITYKELVTWLKENDSIH